MPNGSVSRSGSRRAVVCLLVASPFFSRAAQLVAQNAPEAKVAQGTAGMVATGSTYATQAAVRAFQAGGNAVDAAAAAAFALMVTDPANTSVGGRAQIMLWLADGTALAIDGATEAPRGVPRLTGSQEARAGYQVASIPGAPAALDLMVQRHGSRGTAAALRPAIELAENGFLVPERLAATWERSRDALAATPGAATLFLKPDGASYAAGERFRQPALARLLRVMAEQGVGALYHGELAERISRDMAAGGGYITAADLAAYQPQEGVVVRTVYRGYEALSAGGRAWGNTLAEMLNILGQFELRRGAPNPREVELLARVIAQALADRPQELGTLRPRADGLPLEMLSSPVFAARRAREIREAMGRPVADARSDETQDDVHDTTHLSAMDAEGNAVSLTMSIGPSFGARAATEELGFLYAHSYRMRSDPTPHARDMTEQTPTVVVRNGRAVLVIGGAGSERIPSAILQVMSNVIDRGWSLDRAMAAPRLAAVRNLVRLQPGFQPAVRQHLERLGFVVESMEPEDPRHAGLVHAVHRNGRRLTGAADAGDSGSAAGPRASSRPR